MSITYQFKRSSWMMHNIIIILLLSFDIYSNSCIIIWCILKIYITYYFINMYILRSYLLYRIEVKNHQELEKVQANDSRNDETLSFVQSMDIRYLSAIKVFITLFILNLLTMLTLLICLKYFIYWNVLLPCSYIWFSF